MNNINQIAKDIATENVIQAEKLKKIDRDMENNASITSKAVNEIQLSSSK